MTPTETKQANQAIAKLNSAIKCLIALDQRAASTDSGLTHSDLTLSLMPVAKHIRNALYILADAKKS